MKHTIPVFFIVFFIGFNSSVFSQTKVTTSAQAKTLLDGVSKKYKSFKTIKANFKLAIDNAANKIKEEKKGLLVLKSNKFHVEMDNQEISCDGKTVWTFAKDANEVQVNNYESNPNGISPADIFTMYEKGFMYQMAEVVKDNGKDVQVIELTPTDKNKNYFKIKLFIDKAAQSIVRSKIFDKNGNIYTYSVVQFASNTNIDESTFVFDSKKHPGVDVNDIR
jgi:outer membrane lipoprotein-sorting protein